MELLILQLSVAGQVYPMSRRHYCSASLSRRT